MIFPRSHGQWVEEVVLNSFIQEIFSKTLLCSRHCPRCWRWNYGQSRPWPPRTDYTVVEEISRKTNSTYHHFRCYISVRKEVLWRQNPISSKDSNPCFLLPSAGSFHYTTLPALCGWGRTSNRRCSWDADQASSSPEMGNKLSMRRGFLWPPEFPNSFNFSCLDT